MTILYHEYTFLSGLIFVYRRVSRRKVPRLQRSCQRHRLPTTICLAPSPNVIVPLALSADLGTSNKEER